MNDIGETETPSCPSSHSTEREDPIPPSNISHHKKMNDDKNTTGRGESPSKKRHRKKMKDGVLIENSRVRELIKTDSAISIGSQLLHKTFRSESPTRDEVSLSKRQKVIAIKKALFDDPVDVTTLKQLAISTHGLVNNELRREAWPKLLGLNIYDIPQKPGGLNEHRDYNQVVLDVNRSLRRFPPGMKDDHRMVLQDQLVDTIMRVLVRHDELHYYQGFHDIVVTYLLVCGEDIAFALVDKLSTAHLRDFMDQSMDRTKYMLNYLYPIISKANVKLKDFMEESEVGNIFCLSWLITWFGHVLSEFRHIVRLYDFFIACHPLMPIYLAAAIVIHREEDILASECEMCVLHSLLSKIPDSLPYEELISKAGDLFVQYPPDKLANEASLVYKKSKAISNYQKVQKTSKSQRPDKVLWKQKLEQGKKIIEAPANTNFLTKISLILLYLLVIVVALVVHYVASDWGSGKDEL